ncbi:hypothetical protein IIV31_003R [Armadillidium vulgare iridescent virus]|uniref:Uncharacterized protein n=1 Tax=Armadillidium vulgare iridescent virus TaxID=72201 RepID=A0A068QL11_9VIRU|nr:hypothetical protein IIV31_003R [Armadillidium vulgare iridescent virus]CCV02375.1 hypothetical protein IIV31_003R [Armadillidium vulgare iridescent virus]
MNKYPSFSPLYGYKNIVKTYTTNSTTKVSFNPAIFHHGLLPTLSSYITNCPIYDIPVYKMDEEFKINDFFSEEMIHTVLDLFLLHYVKNFPYDIELEGKFLLVLNGCWANDDENEHDSLPCHCFEPYYHVERCVPNDWLVKLATSLRRQFPQICFTTICPDCKSDGHCFKRGSEDWLLSRQ